MDIDKYWEKALKETEIIRTRLKPLATFEDTELPYIFLSRSIVSPGDTAVRKGKVVVDKPSIVLPHQIPQLFGFDFEKLGLSDNSVINFFLLRGIRYPSMKYNNESYSVDVLEKNLADARKSFTADLERREDIHTGLLTGPDDVWPFSILIFIASLAHRAADADVKQIFEKFRKDLP
ncbi:MAG: hypothetical protein HY587_05635 [Candidatus Omnitrophica bacterium]|nr:hypothetical protein [Candidatus Omnitrophota bacterium]